MAVIWQKRHKGSHYEVRSAGHSLRLYTDGIFHTQWNSRSPVSGSLWDLLMLPAFMHETPSKIKRVLVLGVGGGAVINQLNYFIQPEHIDGVDLDSQHIFVAKRQFGVDEKNTELHIAEAKSWLKAYKGPKFDYIVEDLFMPGESSEDGARRAITADKTWFGLLDKRLAARGVLVMNYETAKQMQTSLLTQNTKKSSAYKRIYRFTNEHYENAIAVYSKSDIDTKTFTRRIQEQALLDTRKRSCKLSFALRQLRQ